MDIKLCIFDLDGTLVDTSEGISKSMNFVLRSNHFPEHDRAAYKSFVGNGLKNLASVALPANSRDEASIEKTYLEMLDTYRLHYADGIYLYPGIHELLEALKHKNIYMAINTNKHQEMTDYIVAHYLSSWQFTFVIGAESGHKKKPDPSAALHICHQLDIPASQCLYIGDSEVDYKTATAAGMKCVLVTWGFRSEEELSCLGPALIRHPSEILSYIKELPNESTK